MSKYTATIGLEIHAELKTTTKMFCNSKNDPDEERPNVNICPVCMGHPGTLPVINKEAVKSVLKVGLALGGNLATFTEFDRKNYFYPDIPKGYQISQYKYPLVSGGELKGVKITRVHLEEDTASSAHQDSPFEGGAPSMSRGGGCSLVDFNRAGVPLMELVTEPVIHSADEASGFAKELQLLLRTLGVAEANMEKGEMRVEANISVSADDSFGTKTEVKNLNSFKIVEKAIAYEIKRQTEILEEGGKVVQETRGWDDVKGVTYSQRLKESSHDYRYFPDPDLPKLDISEIPEFSRENLSKEMPELPQAKRERYAREFGIKTEDIEIFVTNAARAKDFEEIVRLLKNKPSAVKLAANYLITDIGDKNIPPAITAEIVMLIEAGELSSRGAKDLIALYAADPSIASHSAKEIAEEKGLIQKSNEEELKKVAEALIAENQKAVLEYKAGKAASLQFLVGQGMKASRGSANPAKLRTILENLLK